MKMALGKGVKLEFHPNPATLRFCFEAQAGNVTHEWTIKRFAPIIQGLKSTLAWVFVLPQVTQA